MQKLILVAVAFFSLSSFSAGNHDMNPFAGVAPFVGSVVAGIQPAVESAKLKAKWIEAETACSETRPDASKSDTSFPSIPYAK